MQGSGAVHERAAVSTERDGWERERDAGLA